ncbi:MULTISPECIES: glutamate 5-kinase [unclassified Meiothermus]|uniref:glutamate 5-kinase n=1 Tax=unclassified Meiothermus TaxID=370471 RepID=UPI000D7C69DB|nr:MULTISPECIES: glutamate 5-kinase [unclassified Meiothermus]PZA07316.1 glutamate 5-kinase [Meiothermus sp. Pnk-1]RYM37309.1 glutamate 5-kinase [Meiothermus sp. PNK-Is4]
MRPERPLLDSRNYRRLVIKVGSAVLAGAPGRARQLAIAEQVAALKAEGREVVLVSSGAVASGMAKLGLKERPKTMPGKQAAAAVGQPLMMQLWEQAFSWYSLQVAQILLTAEDLAHRHRYLNARRTLETLLDWHVVPVINENDTVMVDEIKFGDNDQLSALIASLVGADLLVVLSDIDALYDADPRTNPAAKPVRYIEQVDAEVMRMAGDAPNRTGTGGMRSKLLAAKKAQDAGIPLLLLPGLNPHSIAEALRGEPVGTFFAAGNRRYGGQRLWLAQLPKPAGEIVVDAGAAKALRQGGASLLPAGIREVRGNFGEGEAVRCLDPNGRLIGVGLVNYSSAEIERIKGAKTKDIAAILGYRHSDEVIHRDHFALAGELAPSSGS